jgi:tripeptidyl-peptidase-1
LRTLYNTIDYVPQVPDKHSIGIANFLGQTNNRSDIRAFLQHYRPDAVDGAATFRQISIAGGTLQQSPNNQTQMERAVGTEGNLDAEVTIGMSYPIPMISYSTGGSPAFTPDVGTLSNTNEPYLAWVQWLLNQTSLPSVISISYADDEQTVPYSYAQAVCRSFAQLGLRGITLVAATGDHGVGASQTCVSNGNNSTRRFLPAFPASCPYLTTVGATRDYPEVVAVNPATGFASGSGFSNYFPRPAYQDAVVPPYIASLNGSFDGLYNKSGRAYPDVAAQGYHYLLVWADKLFSADGTSAAAPTVAALLSLVNDALIAAGKPTLGFLNPVRACCQENYSP